MIIDTHAHIYAEELLPNLSEIMSRMQDAGVKKVFLPNIDATTVQDNLNLQANYPGTFYSMLGLHPSYVDGNYQSALEEIYSLIQVNEIYAIGEIGLDHYWDKTFVSEQEEAFRKQLEWAKELDKPIVIHSRETIDLIIGILQEPLYKGIAGIFHCFTGTENQAKSIIDMGYLLGIGGIVTFKNSHLSSFLKNIPINNLVLETDSPYLSPMPYRGKTNEPSYLKYIVSKLAEIYNVEEEVIMRETSTSALQIFGVKE